MKKKVNKQEIEKYIKLPYSFIVTPEEDSGKTYYVCRIAEFPGCLSHGTTPIEAQKNIKDAMYDWIETCLLDGYDVPMPMVEDKETRVTLRMPTSLEAQIKLQAKKINKSVNQFIVDKLRYA